MAEPAPANQRFFTPLLWISLLAVAASPVLMEAPQGSLIFDLLIFGMFGAAVLAIARERRQLVTALVIGVAAAGARIWVLVDGSLLPWALAFNVLFFAYVAWEIFRVVIHAPRVSADAVRGGMCVYLLMGVAWGFGYALLETLHPGAFHHEELAGEEAMVQMLVYYSFVTLTTLGYGDVTPAIPVARSLAAVESIVGQFYIAVFVATLVARFLAAASADPSRD